MTIGGNSIGNRNNDIKKLLPFLILLMPKAIRNPKIIWKKTPMKANLTVFFKPGK